MVNPQPLVPITKVATLLTQLLMTETSYRERWMRRVDRGVAAGVVSQAAVSKVVTEHLWLAGEIADEVTPRSVRHRIRRALTGGSCSTTTLRWIVDAFGMTEADSDELFRALGSTGEPMSPAVVSAFPVLTEPQHRTKSLSEFHVIGADRAPVSHRTIQVVESLTNGFQTYPYRFDTPHARVTVEDGGTPSPVVPMGSGLWGVWITLSTPLMRGQTRSLVYETTYSYAEAPAPEFRRGARLPVESVNLRVRFHPLALPRRVFWCTWTDGAEPISESPVELDIEHSAERFLSLVQGILVGFRWEW